VHRNRLPARAYTFGYPNGETALASEKEKSPWFASLNGAWRFNYSETPIEAPQGFFEHGSMPAHG